MSEPGVDENPSAASVAEGPGPVGGTWLKVALVATACYLGQAGTVLSPGCPAGWSYDISDGGHRQIDLSTPATSVK